MTVVAGVHIIRRGVQSVVRIEIASRLAEYYRSNASEDMHVLEVVVVDRR